MTSIRLPGFEKGESYRIRVSAYDENRSEGEASGTYEFVYGGEKADYNEFTIDGDSVAVNMVSGETAEAAVVYAVTDAVTTGQAYDRLGVEVLSAPEWMRLSYDPSGYDLSSGGGTVNLLVSSLSAPAASTGSGSDENDSDGEGAGEVHFDPRAGDYQAQVAFYNLGNPELRREFTLQVHVSYPYPAVAYTSPTEWYQDESQVLTLEGAGFIEGTRVYLDGTESVPAVLQNTKIQLELPAGLSGGGHSVSIQGPSGLSALTSFTVFAPYYETVRYKTVTSVQAGNEEEFPFVIEGKNKFTGSASFTVTEVPQNLSAWLSPGSIREGETAVLHVRVPESAPAGSCAVTVTSDQGEVLRFDLNVSALPVVPVVSSLSSYTGLDGEEISIYGYGFSNSGQVTLNGHELEALSWSASEVRVLIDAQSASGELIVATDTGASEQTPFIVLNAGFDLYPQSSAITLQPGESRTVRVDAAGIRRAVELEAFSITEKLRAELSASSVLPNASTDVIISAEPGIENGVYEVQIFQAEVTAWFGR